MSDTESLVEWLLCLFGLLVLTVIMVVLVVWCGWRDEAGIDRTIATMVSPAVVGADRVETPGVDAPAPGEIELVDRGWPADWPTRHEIGLHAWAAHLAHLDSLTPSTTVAPARPMVEAGSIEAAICAYPWDCATALAVARCESTMRPDAVSPDGANFGLLQINRVHRARWEAMGYVEADMLTVGPNLAVAHSIWAEQGFAPWSCYRGGR